MTAGDGDGKGRPFIEVENWRDYQHYHKSKPIWVKLYRDLLGDYDFGRLTPEQKWTLVGLWLLAAETDNKIPLDPAWIKDRLRLTKAPDLATLQDSGFISFGGSSREVLDKVLTKSSVRREEKRRVREDICSVSSKKTYPPEFEDFWAVYPRRNHSGSKFKACEKWEDAALDVGVETLLEAATDYAGFCKRKGIIGTEHVAMATTWLNQKRWEEEFSEPEKGNGRGDHGSAEGIILDPKFARPYTPKMEPRRKAPTAEETPAGNIDLNF